MNLYGEQGTLWAIERTDTRDLLGTRDRYSGTTGLDFGQRVPLLWGSLRDCRIGWLRHSVEMGYLVRGITLPGPGQKPFYSPGPDYRSMPLVAFVRLEMQRGDFEIPTNEELGINGDG